MRDIVAAAFAASVIALLANAVTKFRGAAGSLADRLAAAWWGSMTVFTLVWGAALSAAVQGADIVAQLTGDPQFGQLAEQVKAYIPQQYHPLIPIFTIGAGIAARMRTLGR